MRRFYEISPYEIMPSVLQTLESEALGYAVQMAMKKLTQYEKSIASYSNIGAVPDAVLDSMAFEMRTQYYDQTMPRKIKEDLVKKTLGWYMHGGTCRTVEEYLSTLYGGGCIKEWYQYGGEPYYFRAIVTISENEILESGESKAIIQRVLKYKNVRSWLEALIFQMGFTYEVSVRYENRITMQAEFYPRYNLPFLHLDGTWKLDGSRRLSGYNSNNQMDFYPAAVTLPIEVQGSPQTEVTGIHMIEEAASCSQTEERIWVRPEAEVKKQQETRISVLAETVWKTETEAAVTRMNQLDGIWKLNGIRRLDGGRQQL